MVVNCVKPGLYFKLCPPGQLTKELVLPSNYRNGPVTCHQP